MKDGVLLPNNYGKYEVGGYALRDSFHKCKNEAN